MCAMEEIYIVKVRTEPDPSRLYPSERRYSALTVGGLGAVHLLLAATSLLLGGLGLGLQSDSCWTGRYGGGLWLGIAAAAAGAAGILAWRRWYVDNNIRWFFICSTVAATTSLLCLIITAAALAAIQEQKSNPEFYRSIYYDQGFVNSPGTQEEPEVTSNFQDIPSLSLQVSSINPEEIHGHVEEVTKLQSVMLEKTLTDNEAEESKEKPNDASNATFDSISEYIQNATTLSNSNKDFGDNLDTSGQKNSSQNLEDVSLDDFDFNENNDTTVDESMIGVDIAERREDKFEQTFLENPENDDKRHSEIILHDFNMKTLDIQSPSYREDESTHIMKISVKNKDTNKTNNANFNDKNMKLDPTDISDKEDQYNRPKKAADGYQKDSMEKDEYQKSVVIDEEQNYPKIFSNSESQDIMTMPPSKYEQDKIEFNHSFPKPPSPKQELDHEDQPHFQKLPRSGREVRTVVAINILVASALELAWSLLSASIAWKGMKNCYPHENNANPCERTVEGLERSPPPPPPSSDNTHHSSKRHHKMDGIFRKPDIISNHRHCHSGNNIHLSTVKSKNGINRLHMVNTVSERISNEPYLPMEESTMEYQERVHRFLASNNVANNSSDNGSHIDS